MDTLVTESWNTEELCNVAGALSWQARNQPDTTAIHYPSGLGKRKFSSCTYAELDELSNTWSRGLQEAGIGPGVRTALMVPPGLEFVALFFALFKAGAVPVLIDPGIGKDRLKQCIDEAAPEAFVGSVKAHAARVLLGWSKSSIETTVITRGVPGLAGLSLKKLTELGENSSSKPDIQLTQGDDTAAILFTSGSTGAPKGVIYQHRHFVAQVDMLKEAFDIQPGEVNMPTFPPFALFDPALGMTTVIPHMDPTRPAEADPARLVSTIEAFGVSNVFGSPALLDTLSTHCNKINKRVESVRRVITAGAAVPIRLVRQLEQSLYNDAKIHTPYGATECLPVSSVSNEELDAKVEEQEESGQGVLVGKPLAANRVKIIKISDIAIEHLSQATEMPLGMTGEILVNGPTTTESYWRRDNATNMAKVIDDEGNTWHRMGDVGSIDGEGRLWYCGRVSQRVETGQETLFADQVEAIFNQHPDLKRSALVGVGPQGRQTPVLCIELKHKLSPVDHERVHYDLLQLAQAFSMTRKVRTVLVHKGFPVDIRHNSKINREELAVWAASQMQ